MDILQKIEEAIEKARAGNGDEVIVNVPATIEEKLSFLKADDEGKVPDSWFWQLGMDEQFNGIIHITYTKEI